MSCNKCLFYELNMNDYPCSECTNHEVKCLINDVRQLKGLVQELKHLIKKENNHETRSSN